MYNARVDYEKPRGMCLPSYNLPELLIIFCFSKILANLKKNFLVGLKKFASQRKIYRYLSLSLWSTNLLGHLLDSPYGGAVEVLLVASSLDEEMGLDVFLHLLHTGDKVVVPPVHFSFSWRSGGV